MNDETWASFMLSIWVATASTLVSIVGSIMIVLALRSHPKNSRVTRFLHAPLALPPMVAALLILVFFAANGLGWKLIGSPAGADLTHHPLALGIIAAHIVLAAPFFGLLFAGYCGEPELRASEEAASVLGAGRRTRIRRIVLPYLVGRARGPIVFVYVVIMGSFDIPLLLGREYPLLVSVLTYRNFMYFDISRKADAFVLALLFSTGVFVAIWWSLRRDTSTENQRDFRGRQND